MALGKHNYFGALYLGTCVGLFTNIFTAMPCAGMTPPRNPCLTYNICHNRLRRGLEVHQVQILNLTWFTDGLVNRANQGSRSKLSDIYPRRTSFKSICILCKAWVCGFSDLLQQESLDIGNLGCFLVEWDDVKLRLRDIYISGECSVVRRRCPPI